MATAEQSVFTSSLPELYERFLVEPLIRPFAQELLDRTALTPNARLSTWRAARASLRASRKNRSASEA